MTKLEVYKIAVSLRRSIKKIATLIAVLLILWFSLSWIDVVSDNTEPNPTHAPWNIFTLICQ